MAGAFVADAVTINTTAGNKSPTITPAVGDLLVVAFYHSAGAGAVPGVPTITDDQGGTYTIPETRGDNTINRRIGFAVRDQLVTSAVLHTVLIAEGTNNGGGGAVARISGMTKVGAAAILQHDGQDAQASGTPTIVFANPVDTTSVVLVMVGVAGANPAGLTPPGSFTERQDTGYATPTSGFEYATRDSGHTSATVTYGASTASAFVSEGIELDTSSGAAPINVNLGELVETDSTLSPTGSKAVGLSELTETDSPLTPTGAKALTLAELQAVNALLALAATKALTLGELTATNTLLALSAAKAVTLGELGEADSLLPVTGGAGGSNTVNLGMLTATSTLLALAAAKAVTLSELTATNTLLALTARKAAGLGELGETDALLPVTVGQAKSVTVGLLSELDMLLTVATTARGYHAPPGPVSLGASRTGVDMAPSETAAIVSDGLTSAEVS